MNTNNIRPNSNNLIPQRMFSKFSKSFCGKETMLAKSSANTLKNNDITVKQTGKNNICTSLEFYDQENLVGKARLSIINEARKGEYPEDWYLKKPKNDEEVVKTKPICKVITLVMEDKIGKIEHENRANGKKYGTMCMQRILEWANENGCENRITLNPAQLDSYVSPSPFYAKLGFDLSPKQRKFREKQIEDLSKENDDYSKKKLGFALKNIECGRFLAFPGDNANLVQPEILINYLA